VDRPFEERLVDCPPLKGQEFLHFVNTVKDAKGALDFVRDFGPLTAQAHTEHGEPVSTYTFMARRLGKLLKMKASGEWSEEALQTIERAPAVRVYPYVVRDPASKTFSWQFRVFEDLQNALWVQFLQELTSGDPLRSCQLQHCGAWFEAGRGAGRRVDAKFCCDAHRDRFNSLKRSRRV
jgi:hypothetical protein